MDKIWKHDKLYFMLRPYVDWCTRRSFSGIKVEGRSSIPNDGAVFLAPNHCNTLLDALVILQCFKGATAFGARADIFKKPKVAKILHFLKMVPLARMRDGAKAIEKNLPIQYEVADIAKHGIPFCIFAEGTHRPSYEVMPTKKGIWRLSNLTRESSKHPVYIVP